MPAILQGLRAGKAFTVTGDLISALDFAVSAAGRAPAQMGGELQVARGQPDHHHHPLEERRRRATTRRRSAPATSPAPSRSSTTSI